MLPLSTLLSKNAGVWVAICVVILLIVGVIVCTLVNHIRKSNAKLRKLKLKCYIYPIAGYLPVDRRKGHDYLERVSYEVVVLITPVLKWGKLKKVKFDDPQAIGILATSCEILSKESDPLWEEFFEVHFDEKKSWVNVSVHKYLSFILGVDILD